VVGLLTCWAPATELFLVFEDPARGAMMKFQRVMDLRDADEIVEVRRAGDFADF
jgi:hypothetical protein